jgi:hypothetical protein
MCANVGIEKSAPKCDAHNLNVGMPIKSMFNCKCMKVKVKFSQIIENELILTINLELKSRWHREIFVRKSEMTLVRP